MNSDELGRVTLERDEHVALVTIDRQAKMNSFTDEMDRQINEIVFDLNADDTVRAVVITGAGDRAFCAGSDIGALASSGTNWQHRNRFDANKDYARATWRIRKPTIAAINGYAVGGGLEIACASDIRIAGSGARFAAGEINWGWHGGSGATQLLTRAIGPGHALRMLLTGQLVDAEEAWRIGLVQELLTPGDVVTRALDLARIIAAKAPIATQSIKNLVRVAQSTSVEVGLAYENDMFSYCMTTADAKEGQRAFAEKRPPTFRGE